MTVVDKLPVVERLLWQLGRALDAVTALERRPAAEEVKFKANVWTVVERWPLVGVQRFSSVVTTFNMLQ